MPKAAWRIVALVTEVRDGLATAYVLGDDASWVHGTFQGLLALPAGVRLRQWHFADRDHPDARHALRLARAHLRARGAVPVRQALREE